MTPTPRGLDVHIFVSFTDVHCFFALTRSVVTLRWSFFVHMPFALALLAVFFDNLPKQTKTHFFSSVVMKRQLITLEQFEIVADDGWWWKSEAPEIFHSHVFALSLRHHRHPYSCFMFPIQPKISYLLHENDVCIILKFSFCVHSVKI